MFSRKVPPVNKQQFFFIECQLLKKLIVFVSGFCTLFSHGCVAPLCACSYPQQKMFQFPFTLYVSCSGFSFTGFPTIQNVSKPF